MINNPVEMTTMTEIEIEVDAEQVERTVERCREQNIILPTFAQMKDPDKIPAKVKARVKERRLWDVDSWNLFRVTWKNDYGSGLYNGVNYIELPKEITGVDARILALVGKFFPTGSHKVGATYGCLAPALVTGQFNPVTQKAVWPSTGNYCRGGAYIAALLACDSVAILPEEMSRERFDWLEKVGSEIFATPGCESNVKEIYDKCWELKRERGDYIVILNQFDQFGNAMWHYHVTGSAVEEVLEEELHDEDRFFAYCVATGSAGTLGAGDYLKKQYPRSKIICSEALQCPTILLNGFGGHRIEGIGDKHIPWIHNVRNSDMIVAVDDEKCMRALRLFNEPAGRAYLVERGVDEAFVEKLDLLGISSIGNLFAAIKAAKYYELDEHDVIFTVFTDSMELYESRLEEAREAHGEYSRDDAIADFEYTISALATDNLEEFTHYGRKRVHNLKYYTWIEQQEKEVEELNQQWFDRDYFDREWMKAERYDELIEEFNARTGLLDEL